MIALISIWHCPIAQAEDQAANHSPLRFEFSVKLPDIRIEKNISPALMPYVRTDGVGEAVWSPDGKFILVIGSVSNRLYLIDVERKAVVLPAAIEKPEGRLQGVAWSPDGHTIALRETSSYNGIRLFSFPEFREIARRKQQVVTKDGCLFNLQWPVMQFTSDSNALWIGCDNVRLAAVPVLAAVKLNARTLEQEDTLIFEAPVADRSIDIDVQANKMDTVNGVPRYMTVVHALEPDARPDASSVRRNFLYAYNLNTKAPLFPRMETPRDDRSGIFRDPRTLSVSGDGETVAVGMSGYGGTPIVEKKMEFDRSIELYRTKDGAKILQLGGMGKEYGEYATGFFLRHTNILAIIASSQIVLMNPKRAEVLQRIKLPESATFYPADAPYLAVASDDELDVYRVSQE